MLSGNSAILRWRSSRETLALAFLVAAASSGAAQYPTPTQTDARAQYTAQSGRSSPDPRWTPWIGCWQADTTAAYADPSQSLYTCVVPLPGTSGVQQLTIARGKITGRRRLIANGANNSFDENGCRGTRAVEWSSDRTACLHPLELHVRRRARRHVERRVGDDVDGRLARGRDRARGTGIDRARRPVARRRNAVEPSVGSVQLARVSPNDVHDRARGCRGAAHGGGRDRRAAPRRFVDRPQPDRGERAAVQLERQRGCRALPRQRSARRAPGDGCLDTAARRRNAGLRSRRLSPRHGRNELRGTRRR